MIYLASPYSHYNPKTLEARYELACEACAWFARQMLPVYSPICHWHPIAVKHKLPKGYTFWRFIDEEMIRVCEDFVILKIDGWKISKGIKNELNLATALRKNTAYLSKEKGDWKCSAPTKTPPAAK